MNRTYVALDLEFTGLDPVKDEIIEVAMVKFQGQEVVDTLSSLVKCRREIPLKIQQIVGISPQELQRAPTLRALSGEIIAFVKNHPLVAHSIDTDLAFLSQQGLQLHNLAIDTFELAGIVMPNARTYSLAHLSELLGIELAQNHRALPDALATKDLFLALVEQLASWDPGVLEEITRASEQSGWALRQLFRDVLADQRGAGSLLGQRRGNAPSSGMRLAAEEQLPPLEPTANIAPLNVADLTQLIAPGGLFEQRFTGYEHRPQQVEMLQAVANAFNTPTHLLVEAGTGVGKSLAYLLPAIHFAVQNGRRVIISSNTINLQDQLVQKDIPSLQEVLPLPFSVALLKGRNNYLCLRRLRALRRGRQLTADEARVLAKVLAWLPRTQTGDRAELLLLNTDLQVWSAIEANSDNCLGDQCPYLQSGNCFFYRARARAERAHLVVVNHALLLSDLALENRILPEFEYLVIDEAHHLEDRATEQFGLEVASRDIYAFLNGLSQTGAEAAAGVLGQIPGLFKAASASSSAQQTIATLIEQIRSQVGAAIPRLHELFDALSAFLSEQVGSARNTQDAYDQKISLTPALRAQPGWTQVEIAWENLSVPTQQVLRDLQRLYKATEGLVSDDTMERNELLQELKATLQRGTELFAGLQKILIEPEPQGIYWIGVTHYGDEITLNSAPLHVGPLLKERLFDDKACVILTSATLTTANSFRYIEERLGLEDPDELILGSPFNYQSAVLLYVPKDMPEPNQPYYQRSVEQAIIDLCIATEGRTLVLFTSNSQLNATYRAIRPALEEAEIVVFAQGVDGSRRQLLQNFKTTPKAVLLGTRSFWEGVDVVGQALSCLVIARLPFSVPTDPVFAARAASFEDPFNEYSLPDAILRFRQGFGRLIRSKDDYGLVVVLDKRILVKPYGKTILRSLPPCTARQGPLQTLPQVARRWLDPENRL